jgi:hypothetical protein
MWISVLINGALVTLAVIIHYEVLRKASVIIPRLSIRPRLRVVAGVFAALCGHVLEIWLFGFAYYFLNRAPAFGELKGNFNGSLLDSVYFSFSTYTSLGFGDIEPMGAIRFLAGLEALIGLVLITWSASFMYLEMTKYWRNE